ncbi:MAG: rhodanese-like domain-containing protein [Pseudomonadota bacterium]
MRIAQLTSALLLALLSHTLMADQALNGVWIDVRTPEEFAQGHIDDAQLIPHERIESGVENLGIAKDTPIYVYCAKGGRAEKAKTRLTRLGYVNVTNVGGLDDARELTGQLD